MNSRKQSVVLYVLAAFLAACAAFAAAGFAAESARAETAAEITQSGADFISSAPQEETTYRAGSGTLTYIPAPQEGGAAQIVFDNAEIESGAYVNYWSQNRSYAAVAARGDVELVLKGISRSAWAVSSAAPCPVLWMVRFPAVKEATPASPAWSHASTIQAAAGTKALSQSSGVRPGRSRPASSVSAA